MSKQFKGEETMEEMIEEVKKEVKQTVDADDKALEACKKSDDDDNDKENTPPPPPNIPPPPPMPLPRINITSQPLFYTHGGAPVWPLKDVPGYGLIALFPNEQNARYFVPTVPY